MTTRASKKPPISTGMVAQPKTKKQPIGEEKLEKKRSGIKKVLVLEKKKEEESSSEDDSEDIFLLQKSTRRKRGRPVSSESAVAVAKQPQAQKKESTMPPAKKRRSLTRAMAKEEPLAREGMRKAKALTETMKFVGKWTDIVSTRIASHSFVTLSRLSSHLHTHIHTHTH